MLIKNVSTLLGKELDFISNTNIKFKMADLKEFNQT